MNTKIDGVETRPISVKDSPSAARPRDLAGAEGQAGSTVGGTDISITAGARQLAALEKTIAALPMVDDARVVAAALAIEQGRYQIDAQLIADKLIRSDYELSQAGGREK